MLRETHHRTCKGICSVKIVVIKQETLHEDDVELCNIYRKCMLQKTHCKTCKSFAAFYC